MKDSGVEWIGEIPEAWEVINPKALFRQRKEKAALGQRQLTSSQQYGIVYQDEYMKLTGAKVVTVEKDFEILKQVESGDFVISMRSFQGGIEYSSYSGSISSAYVMLIPNKNCVWSPFYKWLLKSSEYIRALQSTSNMVRDGQAMRYSNFAQVRLMVLPMEEQERIASYLDSKCAEIDKVVEQTRATIEEYKKLKQAIITEAVTKGVRGPRSMKPSGVEWIGDIPEEWRVGRIKDYAQLQTGATPSTSCPHYFNGEIPWFTPGDFSESFEVTVSQRTLSKQAEDEKQAVILPPQTPLIVGIGASAGKVSFSQVKCSCNQQVTALIECSANPKLLTYILEAGRVYLRDTAAFTTLPIINNQTLGYFKIAVPTCVVEQQEIAVYLDTKCAEIDLIIEKKEQLIEELGSYKKSLIYEYVTGKKEVTA